MTATRAAEGERKRSRTGAGARTGSDGEFQIRFEHGRWRHFGWLVAGLAIGGFLLVKLGVVGQFVGAALVLIGLLNAVRFARTLLEPAGAIEISEGAVRLPDGLCVKGARTVPWDGIRHVFFLRRSVPWARTGPILVIETEDRTFSYPRDWFASDSDQRRVAHAIFRRLGRT